MRTFTFIAIAAAAVLAVSCGAAGTMSTEDKETQDLVNSYVSNHEIYIEVSAIQPQRGGIKYTSDGYYLKIKDGKANSYLPFIGDAYMVGYGGTDKPEIEYKDCPVDVKESVNSKGKHTWTFTGKSGDTDVTTQIEFFDSGMATITCSSTKRSVMTYQGNVRKDTRKLDK